MGPKVGLDTSGGEKNILPLPGIKSGFLSSPVHSPVTIMSYMLLLAVSWHDGKVTVVELTAYTTVQFYSV